MKILNFGSLNIDLVYEVKKIARAGETVSSYNLSKTSGGKGLNQSIAVSKMTDHIFHAGKIGKDGIFLKEILEKNGVNTDFIRISDLHTGSAIIQVQEDGENAIVLYQGANYDIDKSFIDEVLSHFEKGDYLILQNEINNLDYIIEKAYEKEMYIILNPSPVNEKLFEADLSKVNLFVLNEHEALYITKKALADDVITQLEEAFPKAQFVLTLGKAGSVYYDEKISLVQKAMEVKAVDTTGAGDTFLGFFVGSLFNGMNKRQALKIATIASGLCVKKKGTATSIPEYVDVKEIENEA